MHESFNRATCGHAAEPHVQHALKCDWLVNRGGKLALTPTGRALLKGSEKLLNQIDSSEVVVLDATDPLAYTKLIGTLASYGHGMLVDPYLGLEDLDRIVQGTSLERIVVSSAKSQQKVRAMAAAYLSDLDNNRAVELRQSSDVHDRVVVTDDSKVFTLGTSLNGIGKKTTILSPVPEPAATSLAKHYACLWQNADPVKLPHAADDDLTDGVEPAHVVRDIQ
ncbi:hypothetical protein GCM10027070_25550 [Barrientosiimonas humi]